MALAKSVELKITTHWKKEGFEKIMRQTTFHVKLGSGVIIPATEGVPNKIEIRFDKANSQNTLTLSGNIFQKVAEEVKTTSTPKVVATLGEEATVITQNIAGEEFELKVLPVQFEQD